MRKGLLQLFSQLLTCFALSFVSACSPPGHGSAEPASPFVPGEWKPSLEQVQTSIQDELDTGTEKSQRYLNRASQNLSDVRDAQLFITYVLLAQGLDAKEQKALFDEQKTWLANRHELARSAVVSKGGSLAPLEYASAFRQVTEKRLAELEQRLTQVTNKK